MRHVAEPSEPLVFEESIEGLVSEIQRYLGAVALFRELGHEPSWRAEALPSELVLRVRAWLEPCEPRVSGV